MEQRVSLITLGVRDMDVAAAFYEALGWKRVDSPDGVIAFDLIGQTLGLYPRAALLADIGLEEEAATGFSGITLGHNVPDKGEVERLTEQARAAGAKILRAPHEVFWGGYIAYLADPDGHIWEIAHNPFSPLGPLGEFQWNGAA
ncbi:MAG: catechol 2,3-dioxygenase-like lactoylglutathione lyase family enzyme [Halocynthiibacter sp.]